jgi:hypothetical protein
MLSRFVVKQYKQSPHLKTQTKPKQRHRQIQTQATSSLIIWAKWIKAKFSGPPPQSRFQRATFSIPTVMAFFPPERPAKTRRKDTSM